MKKGITITAAILSFFIITVESNAETRIRPTGITSPDDLAQVRIRGSFATTDNIPNPNGAVISGINTYPGETLSYGGYFQASGSNGMGVYGSASGSNGRGVWGYASNIGGYFEASDLSGIGAYGFTIGFTGRGVYGYATGAYGEGVHGYATGSAGTGVLGNGQKYDFYAAGPGINYASFTGAHEVKFAQDMPEEILPGMISSVTGRTEQRKDKEGAISLSSTLPTVTLSTKPRDKAVFGVLVSKGPLHKEHWYDGEEGERFGVVNALGEGRVWVTDINGKIQAGDYITTSSVPGYGQMQDDDILHSYTLGKAIETIDWEQVTETVQYDGKTCKRYLIAVVYTSG